jgi:hypothetical protein
MANKNTIFEVRVNGRCYGKFEHAAYAYLFVTALIVQKPERAEHIEICSVSAIW